MKWLLLSITVTMTVVSDLLQSFEMKRVGEQTFDAKTLGRLIQIIAARRYLILSIVCLAFSFFSFMALLQIAPISFAVPASAASLILETVLARVLLKEAVGVRRAAGALLVLVGVVLISR